MVSVISLAQEMVRQGCKVSVVALRAHPSLEENGVSFVSFNCFDPSGYDILHSHNSFSRQLAWQHLRGKRVIFTYQGTVIRRLLNTRMYRSLLHPQMWFVWKQELAGGHFSSRVITVDNQAKKDVARFYRVPVSKISVIPNGHFNTVRDESKIEELRRRLNIGNQFVFLFVARVGDPAKQAEKIKQAFMGLRQKYPDICLVCAPGGESMQGQGIVSTGPLDFKDVAQLYFLGDVLVLSSATEGFPLTIPEAMAAGLPVVATDVCGIPDIVKDGFNGLLVDKECRGLVAAMEKMYLDRQLRERLSKNALKTAESYTWTKITQKVLQVYESTLVSG